MDLLKRIGFYLIGFSIGIVFVAYFFKEKHTEFCYLPNCRVLKSIRENHISYSPEAQEMLQNNVFDSTGIKPILYNGDVDFSKSETHTKPCRRYYIDAEMKQKTVSIQVKNCDSTAVIEKIIIQ
ncbi:DUF4258 domain-containing protein [Zhouia sp. PK063]|uniref:DUF4258 domain-containing protein n=1 Tax=Zhouia sp. PK063 TaxID=3373602 RepID=UPI0037AB685B